MENNTLDKQSTPEGGSDAPTCSASVSQWSRFFCGWFVRINRSKEGVGWMVIDESKNQNFLRLGYISLIEPSGQKHHRIVVGSFMLELAYPQNAKSIHPHHNHEKQ